MKHLFRIGAFITAAATLLVAGCGGGGGGGSSSPPTGNPPPTGGNPTTVASVAVGPITQFGSVWVNGVRYHTDSNTSFKKDDDVATQDDFSVGEMVVVKGSMDDNGAATATSVESNDIVEGPVSQHDTTNSRLVVLAQTVQMSGTTSVDDSCPADLTTAPAVEVYGTMDGDGIIHATRIDCRDATWDGVMEINGNATNVTATTFTINALTVDYSAATSVRDFPTGSINEGDPVEAKGSTLNGSTLQASEVEYKGNRFGDNEGHHAEIEGFITTFNSASDFYVSGVRVRTDDSTIIEGGARSDLGENLKVEVEGKFDTNSVLDASKVEIKKATAVRVTGILDDVTGDTLVILGITVNTSTGMTRFEDKSSADERSMNVGHLNPSDYVEIRGQEQPPGQITAMIVERDDPESRTELQGFVTATSRPELTILGVTVEATGSTEYRDSRGGTEQVISADVFWAAVEEGNVLVDARGSETDTRRLRATQLELEAE